ncbi:MAG: CoB--CoM heterodisulfide reductase iron-sulfur subunit A family protein [Chthonomonadales bacterium]|nr:CoB--CoM heterodisulfide reductase iron-sulfur subunit A family protein [Chthonomonadales bacterium]
MSDINAVPRTDKAAADDVRVGVYVCHCGGNISDVVDTAAVADALSHHPDVAIARDYVFMCSDPGQSLIVDDIKAGKINRVVVAACSPSLHELTFRKALERAGLNPYLYEHVNIREQTSWVHKGDHERATRKAIRLTAAGVEKVARQDPLESIAVDVVPHVVVIGGGIAGMSAAVALAERGIGVTLIEASDRLGGRVAELPSVYPTEQTGEDLIRELRDHLFVEPLIEVRLRSRVTAMEGHVGKFRLLVTDADGASAEVRAGAIILATGFDHYRPADGELGYGTSPSVMTLPEFLGVLRDGSLANGELRIGQKTVKSIAFIHCVGSRQIEGVHAPQADGKVNDYCSRVCCTATLHAIREVQRRCPDIAIYDLHKDIRTYGRGHEDLYLQASRDGALFFRYPDEEPPVVADRSGAAVVTTKDVLTWGEELEIPADLVVLATGMQPRDISDLIAMRKLPVGADRFLQEVHPKLRPVEMAVNGVVLAGACQGPVDIGEACAAAQTAAAKAAILLSKPVIELDPFVAHVQEDLCDGCELCLAECEYQGALTMVEVQNDGGSVRRARVNPALCAGCGACAAVCPPRAINVAGWTLDQFDAMVDAIVAEDVESLARSERRARSFAPLAVTIGEASR